MTILLYHGVAPRSDQGIYNYRGKFIEPQDFERHMDFLRTRYTIVALDEGIRMLHEKRLPRNALAITFDDGYRNFYEYAFPLLKERGMPATMFLAGDFVIRHKPLWVDRVEYAIGTKSTPREDRMREDNRLRSAMKKMSDDERERTLADIEATGARLSDFEGDRAVYAPLSQNEIREMRAHDITFGAHTTTHPILSRIDPVQLSSEIEANVSELRALCGELSSTFAYPNGQPGDWNEVVEQHVLAAGCDAALTTEEGVNDADEHMLRLKRIALDGVGDVYTLASIVSGVRLFLRSLRYAR